VQTPRRVRRDLHVEHAIRQRREVERLPRHELEVSVTRPRVEDLADGQRPGDSIGRVEIGAVRVPIRVRHRVLDGMGVGEAERLLVAAHDEGSRCPGSIRSRLARRCWPRASRCSKPTARGQYRRIGRELFEGVEVITVCHSLDQIQHRASYRSADMRTDCPIWSVLVTRPDIPAASVIERRESGATERRKTRFGRRRAPASLRRTADRSRRAHPCAYGVSNGAGASGGHPRTDGGIHAGHQAVAVPR
jgi:hypothetical protein